MTDRQKLERLFELVQSAQFLTAFTGAGVSTLSGIRDFRGKNGLYNDFDADKIFDLNYFRKDPDFYYRSTYNFLYEAPEIQPSLVHRVLAQLEKEKILRAVVTQNIDLLHQKAGSREVYEIHGSPATHSCLRCAKKFDFSEIRDRLKQKLAAPRCECGGVIKPDITFFGEALPEAAWDAACRAASESDLMLVLGSSLVVQPAANIPVLTMRRGGKIVIVNQGSTSLDAQAELVFDDLESVFRALESLSKPKLERPSKS